MIVDRDWARRYALLWLVLPGWFAFMLYLPSLGHGFVWDDVYFLVETPELRTPGLWLDTALRPLFVSPNYFRPLPMLMFAAESAIGQGDAFVFHFSNVCFHAANTTLVVLLAQHLAGGERPARVGLIAGVLFAIHPTLVENVCWISDRFDLVMVFFGLLALYSVREPVNSARRVLVCGGCVFLALCAKETAVILLPILAIWRALIKRETLGLGTDGSLRAAVVAFALYLLLRWSQLGYLHISDSQLQQGMPVNHLLLVGRTFFAYLHLLIVPFGAINPVHPVLTPIPINDARAWGGVLALVGCAGMLLWKRATLIQDRSLGCMLLALVALLPVLNLRPLTIGDNLVHDRYLILPVAFAAMGLALRFSRVAHRAPSLGLAVWCLLALMTTMRAIPLWIDDRTLWQAAWHKAPDSQIATDSYLGALVAASAHQEAIGFARDVLAKAEAPRFTVVHNLAVALARERQWEEALAANHQALAIPLPRDEKSRQDLAEAHNLRAYIALQLNELEQVESSLAQALALSPRLSRPYFNRAMLHYRRGKLDLGDADIETAARLSHPSRAEAIRKLGREARERHGGESTHSANHP